MSKAENELVEVELADVDDTGDGYTGEPFELADLDLVTGDEPEEGVEVELAATPDDIDQMRVALANAIFSRDAERLMIDLIVREADREANKRRIAFAALKAHCGRLEGRCLELTELCAIYEQELRWPPVARPRVGLLARLLQAVLPWG